MFSSKYVYNVYIDFICKFDVYRFQGLKRTGLKVLCVKHQIFVVVLYSRPLFYTFTTQTINNKDVVYFN